MQQVPAEIWNEIAASQPLSPFWREVMETPAEQFDEAIAMVDAQAEKATKDNKVILAYRLTAPLLMETEALSAFIVETGQQSLRQSLPELNSVSEAVMLATQEYKLVPHQQKQLAQLLTAQPSSATAAQSSDKPKA